MTSPSLLSQRGMWTCRNGDYHIIKFIFKIRHSENPPIFLAKKKSHSFLTTMMVCQSFERDCFGLYLTGQSVNENSLSRG